MYNGISFSFCYMYTDDILSVFKDIDGLTTGGLFSLLFSSYADLRRGGSDWLPPDEFKAAQERSEREIRRRKYQRVSNLLANLRRRGFIEKRANKAWQLTEKGMERLKKQETSVRYTPISKSKKKEDEHLKVIIFDIPEQHKKRRDWLRFSLKNLGFSLLQKSVWIGKAKLPEDFFEQLHKLELLPHIHIFAIQETGSIGINDI